MKSRLASWLAMALLGGACAAPGAHPLDSLDLPVGTTQVLLATTAGWDAPLAEVRRFERIGGVWRSVGGTAAAAVGRHGLGWGIGLHRDGEGPRKQEGDGRAPAGVFRLGPAFGYASAPPAGSRMSYRQATARDYFVDDVDSADYNRWRRIPEGEPNDPSSRWRSFERMRLRSDAYEHGIVVGHNPARIPGRGSAIFVHVWAGPGKGSSGCLVMAKDDLLGVLRWLRDEAAPVLVQVPQHELPRLHCAR
jgi:L,D-peptidoglycan transpeptidase YkuD (ErfK/YbiS/YcfS/YnhG family)